MDKSDLIANLKAQMSEIEQGASHDAPVSARRGMPSKKRVDKQTILEAEETKFDEAEVPSGESDEHSPEKAFAKVLRLVNASDKSKKTLIARLVKEGFPEETALAAVEKAERLHLVDDARFAAVLVRSRISQGKGQVGIERELRENGIDPESVDGWPYDYFEEEDSEINRALSFLEKHPPRSKNKRDGAYRKLVTKGYSSAVASSAARIWSEGLDRA